MAAIEAVELIKKDHGGLDELSGFIKDFIEDKPYRSLLQRQEMSLDEILKVFDWKPDDAEWTAEYAKPKKEIEKLIRYRRRVNFCIEGWRELKEDFGRGDVSCIRDMRTPLVTYRSPFKAAKDEFNE